MTGPKPRIPEGMGAVIEQARERHRGRFCPPGIAIEKTPDGAWQFGSPYADEDLDAWNVLLFEALGTRNPDMVDHFLDHFTTLCAGSWDEERRYWRPKETDFNAILAIVGALRPENEAQAAHAAQLAALHLSAMKLGGALVERYCDPRTAAVLNKTVRAYGDGMERMARLQGRIAPRTIHQTFEVHKHEHVHFEGGVYPNGGQPHRADGSSAIPRPALPRPCTDGTALPMPCGEGQEGVPHPWWGSRLWRTIRRAERQLSPRRLDT